jgi:hypothetical protein
VCRKGRLFPRQALHATRLALTHPQTGRALFWKSSLPAGHGYAGRNTPAGIAVSARQPSSRRYQTMKTLGMMEIQEGGPEVIYIDDDEVLDEQ